MEKEFVTYNQALELKRLGFDMPCLKEFVGKKLVPNCTGDENNNTNLIDLYGDNDDVISAPLQSQVFKWFRNKHELYHVIHRFEHNKDTGKEYLAEVSKTGSNFSYFSTYEECEFFCIDKLIQIIKENTKLN